MDQIPNIGAIRQQQLAVEQALKEHDRYIEAAQRLMDKYQNDALTYRALEQYRAQLIGQRVVLLVQQEASRR